MKILRYTADLQVIFSLNENERMIIMSNIKRKFISALALITCISFFAGCANSNKHNQPVSVNSESQQQVSSKNDTMTAEQIPERQKNTKTRAS